MAAALAPDCDGISTEPNRRVLLDAALARDPAGRRGASSVTECERPSPRVHAAGHRRARVGPPRERSRARHRGGGQARESSLPGRAGTESESAAVTATESAAVTESVTESVTATESVTESVTGYMLSATIVL